MITNVDIEQLLDKNVDLETLSSVILSLNASSSRKLKNPLSFSLYTHRPDCVTIDFCSTRHQLSLCITPKKHENSNTPIMHNHDYYELMYIQKGTIQIQIEDSIYTYQEGDVCLFNQKIHHAEIQQSDSIILYCCITDIFLERYPKSSAPLYPKHCRPLAAFFNENQPENPACPASFLEFRFRDQDAGVHPQEDIALLLLGMKNELRAQCPGTWLMIYGMFCRLMHALADPAQYECRFITLKTQGLLDNVIQYIESSSGRLSREDIQTQFHYNCDYLHRLFRQNTGMTLLSYCTYIYMKKAANLLLQTDDTVEEIAESMGFSNPSQFYRQFKKQFHMTPHEYRKTCFDLLSRDENSELPMDEITLP